MKKQILTLLMASLMTGTVLAAPGTVLEKTQVLEQTVYGELQDGAVVDRINQLDETIYGTGFTGNSQTLSKRVDSLYDSLEGSGTNISLREEMDALEYTYQNSINAGSLVDRVEKMERSVNGRISTGPLEKRIISLKTKVYGGNVKLTNQVGTLASNQVFKVMLNDALSSKTNQLGDTVHFTVAENVMDGNVLLVPAGTVGTGTITTLKKARSFGRNGALDITFDSIPAIDGTEFTAVQGEDAKNKTKSEIKAAGASVAGVVLLGPVGLVGGAFIKGKNVEYSAGTIVYVQPQDSVSIQGLVIGGDGLAHSDDELADAVTVTNISSTNNETDYVDNTENMTADNAVLEDAGSDVDTESEGVEESNDTAENVSQPIVVVKRN
ncbi:MAG: hypothetical protein SPG03_03140 [Veillonella caviae]|uniref:hypothetical protein n=1 Tax=Veillonella caviae TaxID=248316 RepID=UPI002A90A9F6|nr:hypothetical protein [Veillonella caviae]MDY5481371.1 hypothetical protein [Veillonella caviae]